MPDLFLNEIRKMHELRAKLRSLSPEEAARLKAELGAFARSWPIAASEAQLPPEDLDWLWLYMAGRGAGKTHAGSCSIHAAVRAGLGRIHAVAPTTADIWDVMVEGPSGLMKTYGSGPIPQIIRYRKRLEWPNGATCTFFSGEEPDSLRGPQCQLCYIDELAKMRYAQDVFDQARMGLRLGERPRMIITTTPRPSSFMKTLIAMPGVSIARGTTFDNAANLSADFLTRIREANQNSRQWLQEIQGEMILEPEDALSKSEWLIHHDVPEELIEQVTVGVDPSGGGDMIGIVAAALLTDGRFAVLADRSISGSPAQWGDAVVRAADNYDADDVVVETNYGGAMALEVVKSAAVRLHERGERPTGMIRVREITSSRGKALRAEPVSLLFEQGRVLMRRGMHKLEAEMLAFSRSWDRAVDGSPDRVDALVFAITRLSKVITSIPIA
jgi:phage terminase large subunit-like protein